MSNASAQWVSNILTFWLTDIGADRWWKKSDAVDEYISTHFAALWGELRTRDASDFTDSAEHALAAILLFDQFSRNMFRGDARSFATDALAREIADQAITKGFDAAYPVPERSFFYLPFMHSENLADQERSLKLFDQPGLEYNLAFARKHHDMITRFGRFPHRNQILGRAHAPGEEQAVAEGSNW